MTAKHTITHLKCAAWNAQTLNKRKIHIIEKYDISLISEFRPTLPILQYLKTKYNIYTSRGAEVAIIINKTLNNNPQIVWETEWGIAVLTQDTTSHLWVCVHTSNDTSSRAEQLKALASITHNTTCTIIGGDFNYDPLHTHTTHERWFTEEMEKRGFKDRGESLGVTHFNSQEQNPHPSNKRLDRLYTNCETLNTQNTNTHGLSDHSILEAIIPITTSQHQNISIEPRPRLTTSQVREWIKRGLDSSPPKPTRNEAATGPWAFIKSIERSVTAQGDGSPERERLWTLFKDTLHLHTEGDTLTQIHNIKTQLRLAHNTDAHIKRTLFYPKTNGIYRMVVDGEWTNKFHDHIREQTTLTFSEQVVIDNTMFYHACDTLASKVGSVLRGWLDN